MELESILQACILAIAQSTSMEVDWRLSETHANGHLHVGHLESDVGRVTIVDQMSNGPRSCEVWGIDPYAEDAQIDLAWAPVAHRLSEWEDRFAARNDVVDLRNDGYHESLFLVSSGVTVAAFSFSAYDLSREIESIVPRFAPGGALLFAVEDARGIALN